MFRQTKRKPKVTATRRSRTDDEDDDDDANNGISQVDPKSKKRRRGLVVAGTAKSSSTTTRMTTIIDDEDNNDFGPLQQQDDDDSHDNIAPTYNKEALEALKAEQKRLQRDNQEPSSMGATSDSSPPEAPVLHPDEKATETSMNQDFISFHDMEETTEHDVFTRDDDDGISQPLDHENLDDDDQWEQQIAKRAVIPQSTDTKSQARPAVVTPSLAMLRETLQGTIQHLVTSEENLDHAIMRREADLAQTQADEKRQQESIHEAGMACSDYQELRYQLAMWVGALRDLEEKVLPIQKSLLDMVLLQWEVAHQEWRYWQDDVCATLQEFDRLDRVLGWIPPNVMVPEGDAQQQLDEFGRDIGSQVRRDRDNRFRRRKQKEVPIDNLETLDDSILFYLWSHEEGASHRYDILQEALRVAMDDLDDDYTSPQRLVNCFENWRRKYPDEYQQCYANLSLADLAHVFDQVELCRATWVRGCLKENQDLVLVGTMFPTTIVMPCADDTYSDDPGSTSKPSWEKVYRKEYIPFLLEVSKESPSIIFLSKRMSQFFCQSLQDIFHKVGHDSTSAQELCIAFATAGVTVLHSLSIPLATSKVGDLEPFHDHLEDAIRFTRTWQPQWIQNLLLHLLEYWIPMVGSTTTMSNESREPLTHATLSFLSETYLYFLSSLSSSQTATEHFAPIWNCLCRKYRPLLESPDRILQWAPLRAAASAYGLQTST